MLGRLKERLSPGRTAKRQDKRQRRAMQFEMLERRILPSAGGIIASQIAKHAADSHAAPSAHVAWDSSIAQKTNMPGPWGPWSYGQTSSPAAAHLSQLSIAWSRRAWTATQSAGQTSKAAPVQEIIFVDPSVTDYTQLIGDVLRQNSGPEQKGRRSPAPTGSRWNSTATAG